MIKIKILPWKFYFATFISVRLTLLWEKKDQPLISKSRFEAETRTKLCDNIRINTILIVTPMFSLFMVSL